MRVLIERLGRGVSLCNNISRIENQHQRRVVYLAMDLGEQFAILADQIRFNLQAKREVAAMTGLRDLA